MDISKFISVLALMTILICFLTILLVTRRYRSPKIDMWQHNAMRDLKELRWKICEGDHDYVMIDKQLNPDHYAGNTDTQYTYKCTKCLKIKVERR